MAVRQVLEHRPRSSYGENVYYFVGNDITPEVVVKAWYSEINVYDFDKAQFSTKSGHFTQLVWKDSKEIGIGVAIR